MLCAMGSNSLLFCNYTNLYDLDVGEVKWKSKDVV